MPRFFLAVFLLLLWCVPASSQVLTASASRTPFSLDELQKRTFHFFWDLNDSNYQVPDRWPTLAFSSIAATGFGLSSYIVGAERGWITREQAAERVLKTLRVLQNLPQGDAPSGTSGYRGFFYHFLDHKKSHRYRDVELSSIDSGLLMAGILSCMSYFDKNDPTEQAIREATDFLYRRVEWDWMLNSNARLSMGWKPERGFLNAEWWGYNEAMILYILALGSPTHPVDERAWDAWTNTYYWNKFQGLEHLNFGPLFGHQYSHIWLDFRGIRDSYTQSKDIDYFENSRRATLSNWEYCRRNPHHFKDYSDKIWGLTACDGPVDWLAKNDTARLCTEGWQNFNGYNARGAACDYEQDDGTLSPTAAGGSMPFAPEICLPALQAMWETYYDSLVGPYGFKDAFNPSFTACGKLSKGWFDVDYLGIDQGPILLMIENYRSGLLWNIMKKNPYIQAGLRRAGFRSAGLRGAGLQPANVPQPATFKFNPEVPADPAPLFERHHFSPDENTSLPYRFWKSPAPDALRRHLDEGEKESAARTPSEKLYDQQHWQKFPLVIFLHGSGERGNENEAQLRNGILALLENPNRLEYPCYVLAPQCPAGNRWTPANPQTPQGFVSDPNAPMQALMLLIDKILVENPDIDKNRIYLTGLSMGGFGVFDLLIRRTDMFAAAMPLCSGGNPASAEKIKNTPIWIFHGQKDEVVPVQSSRVMAKALQEAGAKVKYTEYNALGHGIWQETFYNRDVLEWLFAQHK